VPIVKWANTLVGSVMPTEEAAPKKSLFSLWK
jgi:hypothetical protein